MEKLTLEKLEQKKPYYTRKGYPIPKWVVFAETMLKHGWKVSLHEARRTVSKYLHVKKRVDNKTTRYKIRFSNHKANYHTEHNGDSDIYVGIGNKGTITTEEVLLQLLGSDYSKHTYTIRKKDNETFILCHVCGMRSYSKGDVDYLYCGKCKGFHKPPTEEMPEVAHFRFEKEGLIDEQSANQKVT